MGLGSDKTNRHTLPYLCIGKERYIQLILIYKIYSVSEKDRQYEKNKVGIEREGWKQGLTEHCLEVEDQ